MKAKAEIKSFPKGICQYLEPREHWVLTCNVLSYNVDTDQKVGPFMVRVRRECLENIYHLRKRSVKKLTCLRLTLGEKYSKLQVWGSNWSYPWGPRKQDNKLKHCLLNNVPGCLAEANDILSGETHTQFKCHKMIKD